MTDQLSAVGAEVSAGDDAASQALVGTLRAWPVAFRSDLIEVAVPDPGTITAGEDVSATQTPAVAAHTASRSRWFAVVPPPALQHRDSPGIQACLVELSRRPTAALVVIHCIGANGLDVSPDVTRDLVVGLDSHLRTSFQTGPSPEVRMLAEKSSPSGASCDSTISPWTVVDAGPGRRRRLLEWLSSESFVFNGPKGTSTRTDGASAFQSAGYGTRALNESRRFAASVSLSSASLWPLLSLPPPRTAINEWDGCTGPAPTSNGATGYSWELNPGGATACQVVFGQLLRDRHKMGFRVGHVLQRDPDYMTVSLVCSVPVVECAEEELLAAFLHIDQEAQCGLGSGEKAPGALSYSDRMSTAMVQCRIELDCRDKINFAGFVRVALFMEPISDVVVIFSLLPLELRGFFSMEEKFARKQMLTEFFFAATANSLRSCDQRFSDRVAAYEKLYKHCTGNMTSQSISASDVCCVQMLNCDHQPLVLSLRPLPPERLPALDSGGSKIKLDTLLENVQGMLPLPAATDSSGNAKSSAAVADSALRNAFTEIAAQEFGPELQPSPDGIFSNWRCFSRLHGDSILLLLLPPHQCTTSDTCHSQTALCPYDALWEWHSGGTTGLQDSAICPVDQCGSAVEDGITLFTEENPDKISHREPSSPTSFRVKNGGLLQVFGFSNDGRCRICLYIAQCFYGVCD